MNGVAFKEAERKPYDVYPFIRDAYNQRSCRRRSKGGKRTKRTSPRTSARSCQAADQNGIAVQFCLFSFHDFTDTDTPYFKYYRLAPWSASGAVPYQWAEQNLIPVSVTHPIDRNQYFTNKNNRIVSTQNWFVGRVIDAVRGLGNVILELFNEPRSTRPGGANRRVELAAWYDQLVQFILQRVGTQGWRPLISVNASDWNGSTWDIETWKQNHPATFAEVDVVSDHGLTGFPTRVKEDRSRSSARKARRRISRAR